jgi:hypothetical protein
VTRTREDVRAVWSRLWLADLRQGLRQAVRSLRRSPAFTATALLVLAIGIGANAATYQVIEGLRLRPRPVPDPDRLAFVELADLTRWRGRRTTAYPAVSNPVWESSGPWISDSWPSSLDWRARRASPSASRRRGGRPTHVRSTRCGPAATASRPAAARGDGNRAWSCPQVAVSVVLVFSALLFAGRSAR